MTSTGDDIYRSQNGDAWRLIRDTASGRVLVRHEANAASGGRITDMGVEEFLSQGGSGPEYAVLRRLMAEPADSGLHDGTSSWDAVEMEPRLAEGETLVGYFPPGDYRLEAGADGVRLVRRGTAEPAAAVDAGSATPASISLKNWNRRLWDRRSDDR
jgi:hypothetical protein